MKRLATAVLSMVLTGCVVVAPVSWWFSERLLNPDWFESTVSVALQREPVDDEVAARATQRVMDQASSFITATAPYLAQPATAALDQAEPEITELVLQVVRSDTGQALLLDLTMQMHTLVITWLDARGGGSASDTGRVTLNLDRLLTDTSVDVGGLIDVPLNDVDLGSLEFTVPLPPAWVRWPLTALQIAFWPCVLLGIAAAAGIAFLAAGRLRTLSWVLISAAALCLCGALLVMVSWQAGIDTAGWPLLDAVTAVTIRPLGTAYVVTGIGLLVASVAAATAHHRLADEFPSA